MHWLYTKSGTHMQKKIALLITLPLFSSSILASTVQSICQVSTTMPQCNAASQVLNKEIGDKSEYEQYKACHSAEYEIYVAEQNCQFNALVKEAEESYAQYQNKVGKVWSNPNFSDNNTVVSYSPSLEVKREIDFKNNVVKISTIGSDADATEKLKKELVDATKVTVAQAQKEDPYVGKLIKATKTKDLSNDTVLPVAKGDEEQAKKEEQELLSKAKVVESTDENGQKIQTIVAPFPTTWLSRKEKKFMDPVQKNADKFGLQPEFVLSIIRTESNFNPNAMSHIPAFGLMQVVPTSAGLDATNYLFGKQKLLSKDYLFTPQKNIEVGSAYLYLLNNRYFKGIKNEESLKYCSIAAYNGGMAPIYRIFGGGSRKKAIQTINTLSPDEVYNKIISRHPATETKNYLKRVTSAEKKYLKNI